MASGNVCMCAVTLVNITPATRCESRRFASPAGRRFNFTYLKITIPEGVLTSRKITMRTSLWKACAQARSLRPLPSVMLLPSTLRTTRVPCLAVLSEHCVFIPAIHRWTPRETQRPSLGAQNPRAIAKCTRHARRWAMTQRKKNT